jgi:hypothetical protein
MESRNIIVHYHIFKNAGSSVDQLLKANFADKWLSYDTPDSGAVISTERLADLIADNPDKCAFSSHQIVPPLPQIDGKVYPIVFVRDPIDRIRSAYLFEWKKQLGLDEPKGSLKEYVESKFVHRRRSAIEEFQTIRFSNTDTAGFINSDSLEDSELFENATGFIESLDFVGIVDRFDESCELLKNYLAPAYPDFAIKKVQANVLQDITVGIAQKRQQVRDEIGDDLYESVLERNALDDRLYQKACEHFERLQKSSDSSLKEAV